MVHLYRVISGVATSRHGEGGWSCRYLARGGVIDSMALFLRSWWSCVSSAPHKAGPKWFINVPFDDRNTQTSLVANILQFTNTTCMYWLGPLKISNRLHKFNSPGRIHHCQKLVRALCFACFLNGLYAVLP